jgi:hypothetical protein
MWPFKTLVDAMARKRQLADWKRKGRKFFICHVQHENDRVAVGHLTDFFNWVGVDVGVIEFNVTGQRPELLAALGDDTIAVIGYNSQLDQSWIGEETFVAMAARRGIPVIECILDHPSHRWPEFAHNLDAPNVRYVFVSRYCEQYFLRYAVPHANTATVSFPTNPFSRATDTSREAFLSRDIACMIPLNLRRLGGTLAELDAKVSALAPPLAEAVRDAIGRARHDLDNPLVLHLEHTLAQRKIEVPDKVVHVCAALVEDATSAWRRRRIFEVASRFPVLIQTDLPPPDLAANAAATFRATPEWTNPKATIERMKSCRSVLSVSVTNDALHDRMGNAISAGCVAVVEDNAAYRRWVTSGESALLFRYDDDSLERALDLVCHHPERAYDIAQRGLVLRDDPAFRFGGGDGLLRLATR